MVLPSEVPVMTLPNAILFPQVMLPLFIFEARYRKMLRDVLDSHRMFAIAMQKPEGPAISLLHDVNQIPWPAPGSNICLTAVRPLSYKTVSAAQSCAVQNSEDDDVQ